jgi:hypothetical protein
MGANSTLAAFNDQPIPRKQFASLLKPIPTFGRGLQ